MAACDCLPPRSLGLLALWRYSVSSARLVGRGRPIGAPLAGGGSLWRGTLRTGNVLQPPGPCVQVVGSVVSYTTLPSESLANSRQDSYKESCSIFAKLRAQLGLGSIPFRQCLSESLPTGTGDLDHSRPSVLPVRQHDEPATRKRLQIPCKTTALYPQHVSQVS